MQDFSDIPYQGLPRCQMAPLFLRSPKRVSLSIKVRNLCSIGSAKIRFVALLWPAVFFSDTASLILSF